MPRKRHLTFNAANGQWRKRITVTAAVQDYLKQSLNKIRKLGDKHDFYLGAGSANDWESHDAALAKWSKIEGAIKLLDKANAPSGVSIQVRWSAESANGKGFEPAEIEEVIFGSSDDTDFNATKAQKEIAAFIQSMPNLAAPAITKAVNTIAATVKRYLDLKLIGTSAGRVDNLGYSLNHFADVCGGERDIKTLAEADWEAYFVALAGCKFKDITKVTRQKDVKQFIEWCWRERLCELPRNLKSPEYRHAADSEEIVVFTVDEVGSILGAATGISRAAYLLFLNCGFTAIDVSSLKHTQLDEGRITHKRVKRQKGKKGSRIPTVVYKLWPETVAAIAECKSSHPELLFTNRNGLPLVKDTREKRSRGDAIGAAWQRNYKKKVKTKKQIHNLRHTASSQIANKFGEGLSQWFLGHASKTTAGRFYNKKDSDVLDEAIDHLRQHFKIEAACEGYEPAKNPKPKKKRKTAAA
ncbi:tyrosine-type recombinase/integrase [Anatilimnocola floriformis]|uniref:tyrosine-type recombinase/integrase n=1 Tax=Anatilimnocola floriformis TaxID=2948575 RepID=UPI0020C245A0|nr:site-specific integrase [Anatilimnocola floriformis]